jgi:hypothetical protein
MALEWVLAVAVSVGGSRQPETPPAPLPATAVWTGSLAIDGFAAGGTQRQTVIGSKVYVSHESGIPPERLHWVALLRGELAYATARKADQPQITTGEMLFGELKASFDAGQLVSAIRGRTKPRAPSGETRLWLYATVSGYHHIAFGLRSEEAYGVGIAVIPVPNLELAADLRYIDESFDGGARFESLALRLYEGYSIKWLVGPEGAKRPLVIAQSVELVPAFSSGEAIQVRSNVSVILQFLPRLRVAGSLGSDVMRNAPEDFKKHYWKTTFGLSYTFGG